jgi:cupin 2 domain-containing protein
MNLLANLLANLPAQLPKELLTALLQPPGIRIDRIVSRGHQSPDGFWYDQLEHERVVVLKGAARIEFEDRTVEPRPEAAYDSSPSVSCRPGPVLGLETHPRH